jgi:hypothetical protein
MTANWGGWLPWNRRWQTEVVSLAEAARPAEPVFRPSYSNQTQRCAWCGVEFLGESAPDGFWRYCTQVCVNQARAEERLPA